MIGRRKLAIVLVLLAVILTVSIPTIVLANHRENNEVTQNHAMKSHLKATLTGAQENPAVDTNATGRIKLKISRDGEAIRFKLKVCDIANVTMAHIHVGGPGTNGPVILFLYGPDPTGSFSAQNGCRILSSGTLTAADLHPTAPGAPIPIANFTDVRAALAAGNLYANVHTLAHPGGEIRAQLIPATHGPGHHCVCDHDDDEGDHRHERDHHEEIGEDEDD